jgi:hypothetical protein
MIDYNMYSDRRIHINRGSYPFWSKRERNNKGVKIGGESPRRDTHFH